MKIPYLYRKLLNQYSEADMKFSQNRAQLAAEVASTFRIKSKEIPLVLKDLKDMKKADGLTQRRVRLHR